MIDDDLRKLVPAMEQYKRLWKLLEDLETLLWNIKGLNEDIDQLKSDQL